MELSARRLPVGYSFEDDGCLLRVTGLPGRWCTVIADDSGYVLVDCWPAGPPAPDPATLAATAMRVLGDREDWQPGPRVSDPDLTLLGRVGLALRAAGLAAALSIHADQANLEVCAQIMVTRPGRPGRGEVRVGEDGTFTWECQRLRSAEEAAARIAELLAGILACARP
ncbi:MAG TPA: hypothetical protein VH637_14620 [Streptosporangiaceae bacterium]